MKRILVLLLILALSSLACADPGADSLSVSSESGDPGDIKVPVLLSITNTSDGPIQGIAFEVIYDHDALELVKAKRGSDLPTDDGDPTWTVKLGENGQSVTMYTDDQDYALANGLAGNIVELQFNVNATAAPGDYPIELADVEVASTDLRGGTIPAVNGTFKVTGEVTDPVLCTTPDPPSWNVGSVSSGAIETWTFDIANCGGAGTLAWTVVDDQDWITVSPESGSDAGTVTVTIDTAGLSDGAHGGTINVSSSYGTEVGTIDVTVGQPSDPAPSLVTYAISETTISPNGDGMLDTTIIDVEFSELVDAAITIEDATGIVKALYTETGVIDPDPLVWDGTDDSGAIVVHGTYKVKIAMDDGVNPVVYDESREIVVADTSVATIAIGDGSGIVTLPITIDNGVAVGACDIMLTFDPSVVNVTNVTGGDMDIIFANLEHVAEGWVRIGTFQTNNSGLSGAITFANVELEPAASGTGNCSLNLSVVTFKDASPVGIPLPYVVSNGTYSCGVAMNGDVNGDGMVDIHDAMYLAKHVLNKPGFETINAEAADVNGSGDVTSHDAMYLAKHVIGTSGYEELK